MYLADHDMNGADYEGRTPLHVAASEGRLEAVKFLVEKCGVNINVKDKWVAYCNWHKHARLQVVTLSRRGLTPLDESREFRRIEVEDYLNASAK